MLDTWTIKCACLPPLPLLRVTSYLDLAEAGAVFWASDAPVSPHSHLATVGIGTLIQRGPICSLTNNPWLDAEFKLTRFKQYVYCPGCEIQAEPVTSCGTPSTHSGFTVPVSSLWNISLYIMFWELLIHLKFIQQDLAHTQSSINGGCCYYPTRNLELGTEWESPAETEAVESGEQSSFLLLMGSLPPWGIWWKHGLPSLQKGTYVQTRTYSRSRLRALLIEKGSKGALAGKATCKSDLWRNRDASKQGAAS